MDIREIIAGLDKDLRSKVFVGDTIPAFEYISTGSAGLDRALCGGIIKGRQTLIYGSKSSGKSSMCLNMVADAQAKGQTVAWIDAEQSFDPTWAARFGVDNTKLIVSRVKTINDMVDIVTKLMVMGIDLVIVDSISSLLPAVYFEKGKDELKKLEDTKQIGAEARDMANAVKMLNYSNKNTALVLISQVRMGIHATYTEQIPTGGEATKFYSSTIIKLNSPKSQIIKGKIKLGDRLIEKTIGRTVDWLVQFNKTAEAYTAGSYPFYFVGDTVGIDRVAEVADIMIETGQVDKAGAWLKLGERQFQGKDNFVSWLRENPDIVSGVSLV